MLAYLADHRFLYIEGLGVATGSQAARLRPPRKAGPSRRCLPKTTTDTPDWRKALKNLTVEFLGNTMDAAGLTLPIYVPFPNPHKDYVREGRTYRTGLYRPGQKVLLKVTVAKMPDVFVLPLAAVAREGAEAYVFRQNGNSFDRLPVHVIVEDTDVVVIAKDGSIRPGAYIAQNAAAALNRALKASKAEGGGGGHDHHH